MPRLHPLRLRRRDRTPRRRPPQPPLQVHLAPLQRLFQRGEDDVVERVELAVCRLGSGGGEGGRCVAAEAVDGLLVQEFGGESGRGLDELRLLLLLRRDVLELRGVAGGGGEGLRVVRFGGGGAWLRLVGEVVEGLCAAASERGDFGELHGRKAWEGLLASWSLWGGRWLLSVEV